MSESRLRWCGKYVRVGTYVNDAEMEVDVCTYIDDAENVWMYVPRWYRKYVEVCRHVCAYVHTAILKCVEIDVPR
jgi:hypothetical protein